MRITPALEALLSSRPRRLLAFETAEDGRVTLLRPKILSPRWSWLLRFLARPAYRVRLDERGSFVWLLCEDARTVQAIAEETRLKFGDPAEDSAARAAAFIRELVLGGFLSLEPPAKAADDA